ncbi:MAG: class I lanthipeptide [Candidatus Aminicenantes bacterium]|nr:class I lanthipeptide [Candidatus Aminicenantes bacterium]
MKKKLKTKLSLNKQTITRLNENEAAKIKGGTSIPRIACTFDTFSFSIIMYCCIPTLEKAEGQG